MKELLKNLLGEEDTERVLKAVQTGLTVVIDGKQGPTGKTTLCNELNKNGIHAVERWEMEQSDNNAAYIVITLNKFVR